jgi:LysR family transcriptional regulator, regulator for metE and metH
MIALGRDILESVASLESELGRGVSAPPTLRVAVQCYTAYSWLPGATIEMKRRGHEVRIRPVVPRVKNLYQAVLEDEIDLALMIGANKDIRVCQRRLFSDELVLVTARDHALARRSFVSGSDLLDLELILLDSTRDEGGRVRRELFPQGGGFRSVSYLPIAEAILEMVKAGLGVSVLTSWAVAASEKRRDVACVRLNQNGLKRDWTGAYRRSGPLVAPARELLTILKDSYHVSSGPQLR